MSIATRSTFVLALVCGLGYSPSTLAEDLGPLQVGEQPSAPDNVIDVKAEQKIRNAPEGEPIEGNAEADDVTKKLNAFSEELATLVEGESQRVGAIEAIKDELKDEFKKNESALIEMLRKAASESPNAAKLENRQRVIAQYVIELDARGTSEDPRRRMQRQQIMNTKIQDFRKANPQIALDPRFNLKQKELMMQIMRRRFNPGGRGQRASIAQTMRDLGRRDVEDGVSGTMAHPGEQNAAIQALRPHIRRLLKLKWQSERLVIDRAHWDILFAGMSTDDVRVDVDHILQEKGVPSDPGGDGNPAVMGANGRQFQTNVERLFHELSGKQRRSYSRGGSGESVQLSSRNAAVEIRLSLNPDSFDFVIEEIDEPKRMFRVVDSRKHGLSITLVGDLIHRFRQTPVIESDAVSVVEIWGDEVISHRAASFAQLYKNEPRFVEERLFALFDHLGIISPASRFDSRIVARLRKKLSEDEQQLRSQVDVLVKRLDADRFTKRESAYSQLRENLDSYYEFLYAKQSDAGISVEVRARISKLLHISERRSESHLDAVIASMDLLNDRGYLEEVRGVMDERDRKLVDQRMQQLNDSEAAND